MSLAYLADMRNVPVIMKSSRTKHFVKFFNFLQEHRNGRKMWEADEFDVTEYLRHRRETEDLSAISIDNYLRDLKFWGNVFGSPFFENHDAAKSYAKRLHEEDAEQVS